MQEEMKVIWDGDLEIEEDTKKLHDLDTFEQRDVFSKKDEGFRPLAYAKKLQSQFEKA